MNGPWRPVSRVWDSAVRVWPALEEIRFRGFGWLGLGIRTRAGSARTGMNGRIGAGAIRQFRVGHASCTWRSKW